MYFCPRGSGTSLGARTAESADFPSVDLMELTKWVRKFQSPRNMETCNNSLGCIYIYIYIERERYIQINICIIPCSCILLQSHSSSCLIEFECLCNHAWLLFTGILTSGSWWLRSQKPCIVKMLAFHLGRRRIGASPVSALKKKCKVAPAPIEIQMTLSGFYL